MATENSENKIYIVVSEYRRFGELRQKDNNGVFKSLEGAKSAVADTALEYLPLYPCQEGIIGYNAKRYGWGEWKELPDTEEELEKLNASEDDGVNYSKEGILALIRKEGRVYVDDADEVGSHFEVYIEETELND